MKIKHIDPVSASVMSGLVYAAVGALYAILLLVVTIVIEPGALGELEIWMLAYLLVVPAVAGLLGCLVGGLMTLIYNFISRRTGGVVVVIE